MLSQSEADALIRLEKKVTTAEILWFPEPGKTLSFPVSSLDDRETFLFDVNRARIKISKCTYQERYRQVDVLVRLDIDGPPHRNPEASTVPLPYLATYNSSEILCPHLHLYVEGFMDRWAIPAPTNEFPRTTDLYGTMQDFFSYCHLIQPPKVQKGLFA